MAVSAEGSKDLSCSNPTWTDTASLSATNSHSPEKFGDVPYISDSLRLFPNPLLILDQFVSDALQERLQASPKEETQVDIISHLLLENKKAGNVRLSFKELQAEANLVVVAGSDTSSNAICLALFHLINTPGAYQRAQEEVDFNFPSDVADDFGKLKECSYLNAVIQETLRMWPPGELLHLECRSSEFSDSRLASPHFSI